MHHHELPVEVIVNILKYLPPEGITKFATVCRSFNNAGKANEIWREKIVEFCQSKFGIHGKLRFRSNYYKQVKKNLNKTICAPNLKEIYPLICDYKQYSTKPYISSTHNLVYSLLHFQEYQIVHLMLHMPLATHMAYIVSSLVNLSLNECKTQLPIIKKIFVPIFSSYFDPKACAEAGLVKIASLWKESVVIALCRWENAKLVPLSYWEGEVKSIDLPIEKYLHGCKLLFITLFSGYKEMLHHLEYLHVLGKDFFLCLIECPSPSTDIEILHQLIAISKVYERSKFSESLAILWVSKFITEILSNVFEDSGKENEQIREIGKEVEKEGVREEGEREEREKEESERVGLANAIAQRFLDQLNITEDVRGSWSCSFAISEIVKFYSLTLPKLSEQIRNYFSMQIAQGNDSIWLEYCTLNMNNKKSNHQVQSRLLNVPLACKQAVIFDYVRRLPTFTDIRWLLELHITTPAKAKPNMENIAKKVKESLNKQDIISLLLPPCIMSLCCEEPPSYQMLLIKMASKGNANSKMVLSVVFSDKYPICCVLPLSESKITNEYEILEKRYRNSYADFPSNSQLQSTIKNAVIAALAKEKVTILSKEVFNEEVRGPQYGAHNEVTVGRDYF